MNHLTYGMNYYIQVAAETSTGAPGAWSPPYKCLPGKKITTMPVMTPSPTWSRQPTIPYASNPTDDASHIGPASRRHSGPPSGVLISVSVAGSITLFFVLLYAVLRVSHRGLTCPAIWQSPAWCASVSSPSHITSAGSHLVWRTWSVWRSIHWRSQGTQQPARFPATPRGSRSGGLVAEQRREAVPRCVTTGAVLDAGLHLRASALPRTVHCLPSADPPDCIRAFYTSRSKSNV